MTFYRLTAVLNTCPATSGKSVACAIFLDPAGADFSAGMIGAGGAFTTATLFPPLVATSNDVATPASSNPEMMMARNKRSISKNVARAGLVPGCSVYSCGAARGIWVQK